MNCLNGSDRQTPARAGSSSSSSCALQSANTNLMCGSKSMKTVKNDPGYSLLQLLITVAVIAITVTFALIGITKARASMRLSNSARQFAAYAERARADAVRRHGVTILQQVNETTYSVTMDFDGSGTVTTQEFTTQSGVSINFPRTVTFDWRGRTPVETSIGFTNESGSSNVAITGSGDVTVGAEIFHDGSIPPITLNGSGGSVVPDPTPTPGSSPAPSPSASPTVTPTPDPSASPTPYPSPTATPTSSPTPAPTPTPTATPTPAPTATPTPAPCTMSVSPTAKTISQNSSGTISVYVSNASGSTTINATSSNSGQIQVSPSSALVTGSNPATFTITVKKESGSVSFSSSCGSQIVNITVP